MKYLTFAEITLICIGNGAMAQSFAVVDATEKVYQTDASLPNPQSSATLFAAQNEFEGFQVVIQGPAAGISVTAHDLSGPGGPITASVAGHLGNIMVYLESFISVPPPGKTLSDGTAKGGAAPDALVPQFDEFCQETRNTSVSALPAGQNAVYFVDIHVPNGITPGLYSGDLTVTYNGIGHRIPVSLTVWPFGLQSTPHLKVVMRLNYAAPLVQFPGTTCCNPTYDNLLLLHDILGVNHRITISAMDDGDDYSTSSPPFRDYNNAFGALIDGQENTILIGAKPTVLLYLRVTGSSAERQAWHDYFHDRGWLSRLIDYAADEPANGVNSDWCSLAANETADTAAGIAAATTTSIEQAQNATCQGNPVDVLTNLSVFIPVVDRVQTPSMATGQNSLSDYASWKTGTREIWEYESCDTWGCGGTPTGTWPSYAIDHSAIRARALEWISFRNGITGEMYWDVANAWSQTPQTPWSYQYWEGGNGDGTLVYPGIHTAIGGTHDIPLASLRLKMIREGVEDYEYMYHLGHDLGDTYSYSQIDAVFPTAHQSDASVSTLVQARKNIACRIITDTNAAWSCTDPSTWGPAPTCQPPTPDLCPPNSCVDLLGDVTNCGSCGNRCPTNVGAGHAVCNNGNCDAECTAGYINCGGFCQTGPNCN